MTGTTAAAEHRVAGWLAACGPRSVTTLTGAGISTDSGIPDFRGPQGLWTRDPAAQRLSDIDAYRTDAQLRARAWRNRRDHPAWTARPNAGHAALVELERSGRLRAVLTQNVDGLHQAAGSSEDVVVELHGSIREAVCLSCDRRLPMRHVLARVEAGEPDPRCRACGGVQKSATVSFGQPLDRGTLRRAALAAAGCDLFLAIGTSLQVQPAASLCEVARRSGARLVIVNADPTPYDDVADAVLREPISRLLPRLAAAAATAA